mmetsp:Transcript_38008/g.118172  ORF Transcript_38008/g.118172 Transcript_38008/m.118172 type:complete len:209 (-) Transcript_38008:102-728(-)
MLFIIICGGRVSGQGLTHVFAGGSSKISVLPPSVPWPSSLVPPAPSSFERALCSAVWSPTEGDCCVPLSSSSSSSSISGWSDSSSSSPSNFCASSSSSSASLSALSTILRVAPFTGRQVAAFIRTCRGSSSSSQTRNSHMASDPWPTSFGMPPPGPETSASTCESERRQTKGLVLTERDRDSQVMGSTKGSHPVRAVIAGSLEVTSIW